MNIVAILYICTLNFGDFGDTISDYYVILNDHMPARTSMIGPKTANAGNATGTNTSPLLELLRGHAVGEPVGVASNIKAACACRIITALRVTRVSVCVK